MGLLQKAVETYNEMEHLAGIYEEGKIEPLAPVGHICTKAAIEITINKDGEFIQARKTDQKIIIPVTEKSAGRTSAMEPHPLCDQVGYVIGCDQNKKTAYLNQLKKWIQATDGNYKLKAVYMYVSNGSMVSDLSKTELLVTDEQGVIKNLKDLICWRVVGDIEGDTAVWIDCGLHRSFQEYYLQTISDNEEQISMISGHKEMRASQHLKGVFSLAGNAKIISSNDSVNFTYKGRFFNPDEALTIGYLDSQKSHNVLKWLVANQGVTIGGRVFLCWNPQGRELPKIHLPIIKNSDNKKEPTDYKKDLYKTIMSYKNNLPDNAQAVIASMEAATSGRLAITYYNELQGSDFLDKLQYWDVTCCWYDIRWGTRSPSLRDIIKYAFGVQRGGEENSKIEVDDYQMSRHVQRLIACKLSSIIVPTDIVKALVQRTYNPLSYNRYNRESLLFVACAMIRKYRIDRFKEEWSMALEPEKRDRSYQFGRLLAVLEKIERDTYDKDEKRETNAIRMQSVFVHRPGYATRIIIDQLKNAYYPRLDVGRRSFYEKLIGEIMQIISATGEDEYNKPLEDTYVLGYYLQKNALYTKKTIEEDE